MNKKHEVTTSGDVLNHIDDTIIYTCNLVQRADQDGCTTYDLGDVLKGLAELVNARSAF